MVNCTSALRLPRIGVLEPGTTPQLLQWSCTVQAAPWCERVNLYIYEAGCFWGRCTCKCMFRKPLPEKGNMALPSGRITLYLQVFLTLPA
uniref:Uncharacterized protein n=1 Tax=Scophthalmus maximus TaxID=52904 RepID=A0A8D2ZPS0_SCOMX